MSTDPADLLTAMLDACRRGLVPIADAARMVGIRNADMADLVAWRIAECAVWRCYESAFRRAFPWTDAYLTGRDIPDRESLGRRYTDDELLDPNSWNSNLPFRDKIEVGNSLPGDPRALPALWQPPELDEAA